MRHIIESKLDFYCVGHLCAGKKSSELSQFMQSLPFGTFLMDFCDKEIWLAMWYNYPKSQCCIFC